MVSGHIGVAGWPELGAAQGALPFAEKFHEKLARESFRLFQVKPGIGWMVWTGKCWKARIVCVLSCFFTGGGGLRACGHVANCKTARICNKAWLGMVP